VVCAEEGVENRVVHRRAEGMCSVMRGRVPELPPVHLRSRRELGHAAPPGQGGERGHPLQGVRQPARHPDCRERVEHVRVDPDVAVGQPRDAATSVEQGRHRGVGLPAGGVHEAHTARGQALPARVADLAAKGECVLETGRGRVQVAALQVDLRTQRTGGQGRNEVQPASVPRSIDSSSAAAAMPCSPRSRCTRPIMDST